MMINDDCEKLIFSLKYRNGLTHSRNYAQSFRASQSQIISKNFADRWRGGAMILAHGFPRGTMDVDAIPRGGKFAEISGLVREVAAELQIESDWLNPHFSTYSHPLSPDYADRLIKVYQGEFLKREALGAEEMLVMKCFAHRSKDISHARSLLRGKINLPQVEARLNELLGKKIPGAQAALDFLQQVLDEEDL